MTTHKTYRATLTRSVSDIIEARNEAHAEELIDYADLKESMFNNSDMDVELTEIRDDDTPKHRMLIITTYSIYDSSTRQYFYIAGSRVKAAYIKELLVKITNAFEKTPLGQQTDYEEYQWDDLVSHILPDSFLAKYDLFRYTPTQTYELSGDILQVELEIGEDMLKPDNTSNITTMECE